MRPLSLKFSIVLIGGIVGMIFSGAAYLSFSAISDYLGYDVEAVHAGAGVQSAVIRTIPVLIDSIIIGSFGLGFLLSAALFLKRPPKRLLTQSPRFRWTLLMWGLAACACLQAAAIGFTVGADETVSPLFATTGLLETAAFCFAITLFYIPTILGEEIIFRSWLVNLPSASLLKTLSLLLLSAVLFTAMHLSGDYYLIMLRFVSAIAYAWSTIRLGGLEFAIGAHLAKNVTLSLFLGAPDEQHVHEHFVALVFASLVAELVLLALIEFGVRMKLFRPAGEDKSAAH